MKNSDLELIAKKLPLSDATRRRNPQITAGPECPLLTALQAKHHERKLREERGDQAGGLPPDPEPQRPVQHEPVAKEEGKRADPVRHLVRIKSFRLHLLDERNLADKYFTDALIYAGCIHGDSTKEAQIIVEQFQVSEAALERTEITITLLP